MYTDLIIRDLQDIIYDVKTAGANASQSRHTIEQAYEFLGDENDTESYGLTEDYSVLAESFFEADYGVTKAIIDLEGLEEKLLKIIEDIKMEELSAQARGRANSEATKVQSK